MPLKFFDEIDKNSIYLGSMFTEVQYYIVSVLDLRAF